MTTPKMISLSFPLPTKITFPRTPGMTGCMAIFNFKKIVIVGYIFGVK